MPSPQIDGLVAQVAALRRKAGDVAPEAHPELSRLAQDLDGHWWREVEDLLSYAARESTDRLQFSKEQRLLLDMGMLDIRLVPDGEKERTGLLHELYAPSAHDRFYFSEWLEKNYRQFVLYGRMDQAARKPEGARPGAVSQEIRKLRDARRKIYSRMTPLLQNLPGFTAQVTGMLITGKIDETIESLTSQLGQGTDTRIAEQLKQLTDIRNRMVRIARSRARSDKDLVLFDALAKINQSVQERNLVMSAGLVKGVEAEERIRFVVNELKLVRNLIKLGMAGAGIRRTHCTLMSSARRVTKADLTPVLEKVEECDPYLPGPPNVLIAPYVGTGFYEWDRDTIFIPLRATRPIDEAIVAALANYRVLLDGLQEGGVLKGAYEQQFQSKDFRGEFARDYRNWVLGVGRGFKGAMDTERYEFFLERLGPSVDFLYAPASLVRMTPEERIRMAGDIRGRINRAEATWLDRYRLAFVHHSDHRMEQAVEELREAVRMNPVDGRMLCALGHLTSLYGTKEGARQLYGEAVTLNPNSIWNGIANDALQKL